MSTRPPKTGSDTEDSWVCACKNIRRQAFIKMIRQRQLTTIDAVRQTTAINTACGICYEIVTDILNEVNQQDKN